MFVSHEVLACLHLEDARTGLQVRLAQGLSVPVQLCVVDWPLSGLWAPLPLRRSMRRPGYAREAGVEGFVTFEYAAAGQVLSMVFEKLPGREGSVPSASAGGFSTFKASCTGSPPGGGRRWGARWFSKGFWSVRAASHPFSAPMKAGRPKASPGVQAARCPLFRPMRGRERWPSHSWPYKSWP